MSQVPPAATAVSARGLRRPVTRRILRRTPARGTDQLPLWMHPVLRRVYRARNVRSAEDLDYDLGRLIPVTALARADEAAALLHRIMAARGRILIVADFDADGATACALAVCALRRMGASDVGYLVPDRFRLGYGLTPGIVELAASQRPALIVTVDNGIASHAGVERASQLGIPVLITDHHLAPSQMPRAAVIVNPNQPEDSFPSKNLAGVGVIFYVLAALRSRLRDTGWFSRRALSEPKLADFLDLVALGTVADVVPLDRNNRILVEQGLRRIRAGRCRPGIQALLQVARRDREQLVAADLAFAVGPRLNAAGRLEDMSIGIECLISEDQATAHTLAERLDALNQERREIESEMHRQAREQVEQLVRGFERDLPYALCLYRSDWHQGVVGIVASRIKERCQRPVIAFADAEEGWVKGSARSVPGIHIRDALDALATRRPGLLERFGGHAMAAGLTLRRDLLDAFREAFDEEVRRIAGPAALAGHLLSDGELGAEEFSLGLARELRTAGPWGQGFPEPLFDGMFRVLDQRVVGQHHLKLRLQATSASPGVEAIAFGRAEEGRLPERAHLAYRLGVNQYQGVSRLQLIVECVAAEGSTGFA